MHIVEVVADDPYAAQVVIQQQHEVVSVTQLGVRLREVRFDAGPLPTLDVGREALGERRTIDVDAVGTCDPYRDKDPFRFWGGSEIINPYGQPIANAELYNPDMIDADLSRSRRGMAEKSPLWMETNQLSVRHSPSH